MKNFKSSLKAFIKDVEDLFANVKFAKKRTKQKFLYSYGISQPILQNNTSLNKITNLQIASKGICEIVIYPKEVFSFWKIVGKASKEKGYKKGHNLINGVIQSEYGGGLCHLSSILYYLALLTGVKVLERYPHSVDFQGPNNRYAPLGSDATVAYGYKDLRLENSFLSPIAFEIEVTTTYIKAQLLSNEKIKNRDIAFEKIFEDERLLKIETLKDGKSLHVDSYIKSR